jgi:RNA polymerase sigma factor (sigma-70 family)
MEGAGSATTRWSLVLAAQGQPTEESAAALASLCKLYWPLLYAYVRRRGDCVEDAQDLTQAFFSRLIEKQYLNQVQRERGRFRSFLFTAFQNFLSNEWDRQRAQKRGGNLEFVSVEELSRAEDRYNRDLAAPTLTPAQLYERAWALALLERATARLAREFDDAGKGPLFAELKPYLMGDGDTRSYAEVAEQLGMSDVTLRVSVHRMRGRFRDVLRAEIAETLDDPAEPGAIEAELRYLLSVL